MSDLFMFVLGVAGSLIAMSFAVIFVGLAWFLIYATVLDYKKNMPNGLLTALRGHGKHRDS